jgi:hypothetical protein
MLGDVKVRYLEHRPDEWLVGVAGLTPEQNGIFRTICDLIASSGGPIPIGDERLFSIIRAKKNRINRVIGELLSVGKLTVSGSQVGRNGVITGQQLSNKRVISELERVSKRVRTGEDLASKRWKTNGLGDAGRNARARNEELRTKNEEQEEDSFATAKRQSARQIAVAMVEVWHLETGLVGLPPVKKLTDARVAAARKRFADDFAGDIEKWREYLRRVVKCPFLIGQIVPDEHHRIFRADFGWVLKPDNMAKVMEGKYDAELANGRDLSFYDGPTEPPPPLEGSQFSVGWSH